MQNRPEVLTNAPPLTWVLPDQPAATPTQLPDLIGEISKRLTQGATPLCRHGVGLYLTELLHAVVTNPSAPNLSRLESPDYQCLVASIKDFDAVRSGIIKEIREALATS